MPKEQRSIKGLPNWVWVYDGEAEWTTRTGKKSRARHAYNPLSGATMSVKDTQTLQKYEVQEQSGVRRAPSQQRQRTYTYKGQTLRKQEFLLIYFRSLDAAQSYVQSGALNDYSSIMIQAYYQVKLKKGRTSTPERNGYVSLTSYYTMQTAIETDIPWNEAEYELMDFELGNRGRIILRVQ